MPGAQATGGSRMCIYPIVWIIGTALATYLFNFRSNVRFWALGLMVAPPMVGVTLALANGSTGDPVKDAALVNWWLAFAALSTTASLCLSLYEIVLYRSRVAEGGGSLSA
jgi:hypothetical protein